MNMSGEPFTASYQALREQAAWIDLPGRGLTRMTGEDRARLLHAMSTQHIQQMKPGDGAYAFFLNAQGRILADVDVFCLDDAFLVSTAPESQSRLYEHLDKFIIADDVTLEDVTASMAVLCVAGPGAAGVLTKNDVPLPVNRYATTRWSETLVARTSPLGADGFTLITPAERRAALITAFETAGAIRADAQAVETARLENGLPLYGVDFNDGMIPQETRRMEAIHFTKGCYLGQEIVERVRSRGHLNRMLTPVTIDTPQAPAPGAKIELTGKEVGRLTSAAWSPSLSLSVGFAVLRAEAVQAPAGMLQMQDGGAQVTVRALPAGAAGS